MFAGLGRLRGVYHWNCASFRPWPGAHLVSHVLACEFAEGIILVDSGIGSEDIAHPRARLGAGVLPLRPALQTAETAIEQLSAYGWKISDVKGIVATHLDYDHIGGAGDFPGVPIVATQTEMEAASARSTFKMRMRYRDGHLQEISGRTRPPIGDQLTVLGLSTHPLEENECMYLAPMAGHTPGHAAVALNDPKRGWMVHAGDAFMHRQAICNGSKRTLQSRITSRAELLLASDRPAVHRNHQTLAALAASGDAQVFCSHDREQFEMLYKESVVPVVK